LIIWKIIEIVATRCYILKLKCTKFDFGSWEAPSHPKLNLREPTSKGNEGRKDCREGQEGETKGEGR